MLHLNNRAASDHGPAIETFGVSELELASASRSFEARREATSHSLIQR
jgi:hypothetical protein